MSIIAEEVERAVLSLKNNKAAGSDGLICVFQTLFNNHYSFSISLFNDLFENGLLPDPWSEATIKLL